VNPGKIFERDFANSSPANAYIRRLRDCGGMGPSGSPRYVAANPFDFFIFRDGTLFALELKSTKSTSLSYGQVKDHQLKGLLDALHCRGVVAGVVVNFRRSDPVTVFLPVDRYIAMREASDRKSFRPDEAVANGMTINVTLKPGRRPRYDLDVFLREGSYYDETN
jgi:hypothetical protein